MRLNPSKEHHTSWQDQRDRSKISFALSVERKRCDGTCSWVEIEGLMELGGTEGRSHDEGNLQERRKGQSQLPGRIREKRESDD